MEANITVCQTEAVLIEYPGFVNNAEAALDSLGGLQAVSIAASSEAHRDAELALVSRPGDPLAHPIVGDRQPTKGLILHITRSAAAASNGAKPGLDVNVTARVGSTFQFNSLADFQYISSSSGPSSAQVGGADS